MNEHDTESIIPPSDADQQQIAADLATDAVDLVNEKLADALTPGYQAEFDPHEAELAGAFLEDALTAADALDSTHDAPLVALAVLLPTA